ncbi:MAG: sporulation protein [candidate division Zixibacteria bacterium]|jgi:uncharacterized spore protein YtfJ|nr:sporulation protein [candidate division Zixibacteria bacterium]
MPTRINELLTSIIGQLKGIAETESIVGKPITFGDKMLVPVSRLSVGFGAGGGEDESKGVNSRFGGGGGGGAKVEPVGFIIYDGDSFSFLPTTKGKFDGIIEAIPDLINKIKQFKKDSSVESKDDNPKENK